jgi:hypothetical protein
MRRLIAEWTIGPFVVAFFWPPFARRRRPKPAAALPPVPMDDEATPLRNVVPITRKEQMPR